MWEAQPTHVRTGLRTQNILVWNLEGIDHVCVHVSYSGFCMYVRVYSIEMWDEWRFVMGGLFRSELHLLSKTTTDFGHCSRCPCGDSEQWPPGYKSEVLPIEKKCSIPVYRSWDNIKMCLGERFLDLDWTGTGIALLWARQFAKKHLAPEAQKCIAVR